MLHSLFSTTTAVAIPSGCRASPRAARRSLRVLPWHLPPLLREPAAPHRAAAARRCWCAETCTWRISGVYKGDNRLAYFDLSDFDEATLAPFTLDLLRFVTSIHVAAREHFGCPSSSRRGSANSSSTATGTGSWTAKRAGSNVGRQKAWCATCWGASSGAHESATEVSHHPHRPRPAATHERARAADRETASAQSSRPSSNASAPSKANSASTACSMRPGAFPARGVLVSNVTCCWLKARARRAAITCST